MHETVGTAAVWLLAAVPAWGQPPTDLRALERSFKAAVANAEAGIACVFVSRQDLDAEKLDEIPEYFGSGVVIDHRLVLTCYHVVRDAKAIAVRLPGLHGGEPRRSRAVIYAADNRSDLAVLLLENQGIDTPPTILGRGEELTKGSIVVGLSNPVVLGFRETGPTASWGIIANTRHRLPSNRNEPEHHRSIHNYGTLLETDARLHLTGSGCALVDLDGKLVGLTTNQVALPGGSTGAMAIPIDAGIRRIVDVLRKGEEVEYGFLGVHTNPWRTGRNNPVTIRGVTANSPAHRAGIQPGDVILQVNGQQIRESDDMFLQVGLGLAGRESTIVILRPGESKPRTIKATLAKLNNPDHGIARNRPSPVRGLWVDYPNLAAISSDHAMPEGVVVREVQKGSPAEAARLGEFTGTITEINGTPIRTPAEFYREAEKLTRAKQPIRLRLSDDPPRVVELP